MVTSSHLRVHHRYTPYSQPLHSCELEILLHVCGPVVGEEDLPCIVRCRSQQVCCEHRESFLVKENPQAITCVQASFLDHGDIGAQRFNHPASMPVEWVTHLPTTDDSRLQRHNVTHIHTPVCIC
jgi:hypothetical protein